MTVPRAAARGLGTLLAPPPTRLGDLAAGALPLAERLAGAVHDPDPDAVAEQLDHAVQLDRAHLRALLVVLAALVDVTADPAELLGWVVWDDHGRPLPLSESGADQRHAPRGTSDTPREATP